MESAVCRGYTTKKRLTLIAEKQHSTDEARQRTSALAGWMHSGRLCAAAVPRCLYSQKLCNGFRAAIEECKKERLDVELCEFKSNKP